ncbi:MAG: flagellar basal body P-ring protein FlgI, partial [Planctomycetes bacterium]|nr:flagellar basal body P-ring protein FlgI [Planctomycetota bacterium]
PAILEEPVSPEFATNLESMVLVLERPSFPTASRIADAISRYPYFELDAAEDVRLARAIDSGSVRVRIPTAYIRAGTVVDFISQVLSEVEVPEVGTEGRIVLNSRAKTVVINGEVRVTPVAIRWKDLSIRVPPADWKGPERPLLIDVIREIETQGPDREMLTGEDLIGIVRDMYRAGAIEGKLVEQ